VERDRQPGRGGKLQLQTTLTRLPRAIVAATLVVLALGAATRIDPVPLGADTEPPSADHVGLERLTGAISPLRDGVYRFAVTGAGSATILIDGQPIAGPIQLSAGAHSLLIDYPPPVGSERFEFLWARGSEALSPVPAWALRPHKIRSLPRLMARAALDRLLAISEWIWVGLLVLAAASLARSGLARLGRSLERVCDWRTLTHILAASLVLNAIGIWWGLPGSWVAIELKPVYVLGGLAQHFSHGWFDAYPPFHFYLLTVAWSPLLLLSALGRLTFDGAAGYSALVLVSRAVSLAMAAGIVGAACVCGSALYGRRAGLIAAAIVALITPLVYYAKTANVDVPYLFWWALSMVFYMRLLDAGRLRDYLWFAMTATLSVCTKDQAYGLYLLPPLVIVEQLWRTHRAAAVARPFWRAVSDRRLWAAAFLSAFVFALCQNLAFNAGGFVEHVRFIVGPGSGAYQVYEATAAGRLALLVETLRLIQISMGWPLVLAGASGLVIALADGRQRRAALWLVVPALSYYLGFINVILYNYDRFVIPICFVLAIFGGLTFDRLLSAAPPARRVGAIATAVVFAYTLLYSATVDVLMVGDSRYEAEAWMHAHAARHDIVAVSGLHEYLPRLDDFSLEEIATIEELKQEHPAFVVMNADYGHAVPPDTAWGQMIAGLERESLGYRRVCRFRRPSPWPWLPAAHPDLVGARHEAIVFSTLRNINPTIDIYERAR
jgi:hypothetical protein